MPKATRPVASDAMSVVPLPRKGSWTAWPGLVLFRRGRRMHWTGFWAPCTVDFEFIALCSPFDFATETSLPWHYSRLEEYDWTDRGTSFL
jgi:hypothetical protein